MPYITVLATFLTVSLIAAYVAFSKGEVHRLLFVLLPMLMTAAVVTALTAEIADDRLFIA